MTTETTAPASSEPAFGRDSELATGGWKPLPKKEQPVELSKSEGAELNTANHADDGGEIVQHHVHLDDNVAFTVEQAADMLNESRAAHNAEAEISKNELAKAQAEIDKLRGVEPEAPKPAAAAEPEELDLAKAMEKSPKLKAEIEAHVKQTSEALERHGQAIQEAGRIAIAGLVSVVPEIANADPAQWEGLLRGLAQTDPPRFNAAMNQLRALQQVENAQQQLIASKRASWNEYARAEDAAFADAMKGEKEESKRAISDAIETMLKDYGVDRGEFLRLANSERFVRSVAAQRIIADAARYRLMVKGKSSAMAELKAKVVPASVPPVMRPGVVSGRGRTEDTVPAYQTLSPRGQQAFRTGYASPLIEAAQGGAVGVNKARPLTSDALRDEAAAMAPGNDLMQRRLGRENTMFETRNAALGGSATAQNLADAEALSHLPSVFGHLLSGNIPGAVRGVITAGGKFMGNTSAVRASLANYLLLHGGNLAPGQLEALVNRTMRQLQLVHTLANAATRSAATTINTNNRPERLYVGRPAIFKSNDEPAYSHGANEGTSR